MASAFYYIHTTDWEDQETHDDDTCCCVHRSGEPHQAYRVHIYALDHLGLKMLYALSRDEQPDGFHQWLRLKEPHAVICAINKGEALTATRQYALEQHMLVINFPKDCPAMEPLLNALSGVVDPTDGYLDEDECECDRTHKLKGEICRVCYGRFVAYLLDFYVYKDNPRGFDSNLPRL